MQRKISQYILRLNRNDSLKVKHAILGVFILATAFMFPLGTSVDANEYSVGMIWTENDLYAPFPFPIYKDEMEYERERQSAASKVYKVFEDRSDIAQGSLDSLQNFFSNLRIILDRKKSDSLQVQHALSQFPITFTEHEWQILWLLREAERKNKRTSAAYSFENLQRDVLLVANGLYLQGIIDARKIQHKKEEKIAKRKKTAEQIIPLNKFLDRDELGKIVQQTFFSGYKKDNDTVSIAVKIVITFLTPNVLYQKEQTEREIQFAVDAVPRTLGIVQEGERIIGKRERISAEAKLKLDSFRRSKQERGSAINAYISFIGKILHISAIMWLIAMYIFLFRKKIFHENAKLLLIGLLYFAVCINAYLTVAGTFVLPLRFLIILPAASMLIAIIFDSRVAFYSTVVMSLLVAGIRSNDYSIAFASIVAGTFSVYTVRDIKKRTQIFRSIIYIFLGYVSAILALGLERNETYDVISNQLLIAFINSVVSPVVTYGLLIIIERSFHFTTDLGLMELADLNHPLLKELSHKAPGTFHHSVSVAALAEDAAEAIGANAILARVGAYYHDIGKTANPQLFVENQLGTENKHRVLSPRKSARIIASHVQDGIDFARKNNLPELIINFIPMHHGTMRIGTFYEKALKQKKENTTVDEKDFRYPGPKPNSKETAILMLADGVEASTRAIEEPTIEKIEKNIETLVKQRFLDGELDEANLTIKELNKIQESFVKILIGVHHSRIQYAEQQTFAVNELAEEKTIHTKAKRAKANKNAAADKRLLKRIDSIDTP